MVVRGLDAGGSEEKTRGRAGGEQVKMLARVRSEDFKCWFLLD